MSHGTELRPLVGQKSEKVWLKFEFESNTCIVETALRWNLPGKHVECWLKSQTEGGLVLRTVSVSSASGVSVMLTMTESKLGE